MTSKPPVIYRVNMGGLLYPPGVLAAGVTPCTIVVSGIAYGDSDTQTPIQVNCTIQSVGTLPQMTAPNFVYYEPLASGYDQMFKAIWLYYPTAGTPQELQVRQAAPGDQNFLATQTLSLVAG